MKKHLRHRVPAARTLVLGLALAAGSSVLGCKKSAGSTDPTEGSLHLPKVGHTLSVEQDPEAEAPEAEADSALVRRAPSTLPKALVEEVALVQKLVETWWVSRADHVRLDGLDVSAVFTELDRRAESMNTKESYAEALRYALCELGDGQLRILEGPSPTQLHVTGMSFVDTPDGIVVPASNTGAGKGAGAQPEPGDRVIEVDGEPVEAYLERSCLRPASTPVQRRRRFVESLSWQSRWEHEKPRPRTLRLERMGGETYEFELDWHIARDVEPEPCVTAQMIDRKAKIGRLDIHTFWCVDERGALDESRFAEELSQGLSEIRRAQNVIVDLRDNPGGADALARLAAQALTHRDLPWVEYRHKAPYESMGGWEIVKLDARRGKGPLDEGRAWLMVGPGCASTCEIFAGALAKLDEVELVGEMTAGSVGNPEVFRLPYSGFSIAVPRTEYRQPGSEMPIEARGISPDVEVVFTRDDATTGKDPVFVRVTELIRGGEDEDQEK